MDIFDSSLIAEQFFIVDEKEDFRLSDFCEYRKQLVVLMLMNEWIFGFSYLAGYLAPCRNKIKDIQKDIQKDIRREIQKSKYS